MSKKIIKKNIFEDLTATKFMSFQGNSKNATLCLDGKKRLFVINILSKRHHNKSYNYENNKKSRQKARNSVEKSKKVSKPFES